MNGQRAIHFPKPGRLRKGVLLSSEPIYLLEFSKKEGKREVRF